MWEWPEWSNTECLMGKRFLILFVVYRYESMESFALEWRIRQHSYQSWENWLRICCIFLPSTFWWMDPLDGSGSTTKHDCRSGYHHLKLEFRMNKLSADFQMGIVQKTLAVECSCKTLGGSTGGKIRFALKPNHLHWATRMMAYLKLCNPCHCHCH